MNTNQTSHLPIGAVAKRAAVGIDTVRYYEREGLLPAPRRRASGYRDYDAIAVDRLRFIPAPSSSDSPSRKSASCWHYPSTTNAACAASSDAPRRNSSRWDNVSANCNACAAA